MDSASLDLSFFFLYKSFVRTVHTLTSTFIPFLLDSLLLSYHFIGKATSQLLNIKIIFLPLPSLDVATSNLYYFTNLLFHEICLCLIHVLQNLWYFISLLRNSRHKHFLKLCCYSDAQLCLKAFSTPVSSVPSDSPLLLLFIFCFIPLFPLAFKCFLSFLILVYCIHVLSSL